MIKEQIEALDSEIAQAREWVALGDSLERLLDNRDFKKVVKDGYFRNEAIRLVHLKADPAMQSDSSQKAIVTQIDAVGALSQYLHLLSIQAGQADKAIAANEETREELLSEEQDNG